MRIYFAGPLFTEEDKKIDEYYAAQFRAMGDEVYLPQEYKIPDAEKMTNRNWAIQVNAHDMKMLEACDMVIAIVRGGKASDDGTAFEIGYAAAMGKRVFLYVDERNPISLMFLHKNIHICKSADEFDEILKESELRYT